LIPIHAVSTNPREAWKPVPALEIEGKPAAGTEIVLHLGLEVYTELIFERDTEAENLGLYNDYGVRYYRPESAASR
jgi:hypothetical protein